MNNLILLFTDLCMALIFWGITQSRYKKDWEMLSNDYELMESLAPDVQKAYWREATQLQTSFFIGLFVIINLIFLLSPFSWFGILFGVILCLFLIIWYGFHYRKLIQKYRK